MGVLLASKKSLSLFFYGWGFCLHSVGNGGGVILKAFVGRASFFGMRVRGGGGAGFFFGGIFFDACFITIFSFVDFWTFSLLRRFPSFLCLSVHTVSFSVFDFSIR